MTEFTQLRPWAKAYVGTVVLLGAAIIGLSVRTLYVNPIGTQWFVLAALTLLTGSFTIKVPSINASISVSETFVFASVLLFGPSAGAMTVVLECLTIAFWMNPKGRAVHILLFNTAAPAIAIWTSGTLFYVISGIQPYSNAATPLRVLVLPLVALTILYFLLNSWLVTIALSFETKKSPLRIWWTNFTWLSINYFSGASVAALIVTYTRELDITTLGVIVPLLVVSYLTFRTSMARVEDANTHLIELNQLYLRTVETLAMAIDAKDQITHGHIRRVQTYAVGLAGHVGIADKELLRAIEAAALLHDMGKLAVPEYILNKPGPLTPAEFEKMKLHAAVGADILSAIDFPYPVVPIVRHHHEHWNGDGYPDGLRGTDIPIGARILSVVDCFDALTSDRPYRPRLSDNEAIRILVDRRGTMYDPLIVDTFLRVHQLIAPPPNAEGPSPFALKTIARSTSHTTDPRLDDISASAGEGLALLEIARDLANQSSLDDIGNVITNHLRRLIPYSVCIIYCYQSSTDELDATYVTGESASVIRGLRMPLGARLSGWVAANRQTIANSDPLLDLGEIARFVSPRLRSCLSTWLPDEDQLRGVISLYSTGIDHFSDEHRRLIEAIARQLGRAITRCAPAAQAHSDPLASLGSIDELDSILTRRQELVLPCAVVFITISNLHEVTVCYGQDAANKTLRHVIGCAHRRAEVNRLFRDGDEIIALIADVDSYNATIVAREICATAMANSTLVSTGPVGLDVMCSVVAVPQDGHTLAALAKAARHRNGSRPAGTGDDSRVH